MNHLTTEALARLIEEAPTEAEERHLGTCPTCRDELEALREQTAALRHLPTLRPPSGGWDSLERALQAEGLVRRAPSRLFRARELLLPQAVAATLVLIAGMALGVAFSATGHASVLGFTVPGERAVAPMDGAFGPAQVPDRLAVLDPDASIRQMTLEEATDVVQLTEEWYHAALVRYGELLEEEREQPPPDPVNRYAALEQLMAASREAVRDAPMDPFLNGLLVNMHAEREATLRTLGLRSVGHNWY